MRNRAVVLGVCSLILLGWGCRSDAGRQGGNATSTSSDPGKRSEKIIDLPAFTGIELRLAAEVELTPGEVQEILVQGPSEVLENLNTEVKNGIWIISTNKKTQTKDVKVFITSPLIERVILSSSGSVSSTGIFKTKDAVELSLSGSGNIHFLAESKRVMGEVSGSGDIRMEGKTGSLEIEISGSGSVDASNLESEDVEVDISGSGDCRVDARDKLDVDISGSGEVRYKGNPKLRSKIQGSGNVSPMN